MKKISIILACALLALAACTKSKEVHPEIGDGNDEIMTVGMKDVHVEYTRTDHAELQKVVFHYSLTEEQQFAAAEMTKQEAFFELTLNDLLSDTLYYYYYELFPNGGSAYQTNQKTFHTQVFDMPEPPEPPTPQDTVPEGIINGLFSVSRTQKVYFSQGNLQYQASTNTWRFAENQWDYVGDGVHGTVEENGVKCNNELISSTYDGWIDLFGWGTSGYNHGAVCYQPWSSTTNYVDYCAYGYTTYPNMYNLDDQTGQADWGVNAISNGGNSPGIWRTLTHDELDFLIYTRDEELNLVYTFIKAQVDGINGIIIFPDDWDASYYSFNNVNPDADFDSNIINATQWDTLKQYGVVFLPAAGRRFGRTVSEVLSHGFLWSATYVHSNIDYTHAHSFYFTNVNYSTGFENPRYTGCSVRLVQDVTP